MRAAIAAGTAYFLLAFAAGFALGALRTLVIAPRTGDLAAVAIELPFMLAISWLACRWTLRRFAVAPGHGHRLAMGGIALLLLLAAEALLSMTLGGRDLAQHLALYRTAPVRIGLAGQVLFALFPVLQSRR